MKKEYHYTISRTDRIYLVVFVSALLGWELIKGFFPGGDKQYEYVPRQYDYPKAYKNEYRNNQPKSFSRPYDSKPYSNQFSRKPVQKDFPIQSPPSSPLPIMTASIPELTSMGFSVNVAFNIQKFIAAGGIISKPQGLMKIYGMDSVQLLKAAPYIIYTTPPAGQDNKFSKKENIVKLHSGMIDLNTATVPDLESLNGIGIVLAERIIKFRESLGGFTHPEQLKDCYGITPELFAQLKPQLSASGSFTKIRINEEDLSTLTHPYMNKKMIRLVKAYMDQHGPFKNAEELKKVYPADTAWFNKILPYISFEVDFPETSGR